MKFYFLSGHGDLHARRLVSMQRLQHVGQVIYIQEKRFARGYRIAQSLFNFRRELLRLQVKQDGGRGVLRVDFHGMLFHWL